jgi:ubiquinone biosynthesis protein Coq4
METSVSALVKKFLSDLTAEEGEFERLKKMEQALRDRIVTFRASDRLSRDGVNKRGR